MSDSSEKPTLCLVCNDKSSGRHYGVLTCDGCRGFFKRSVRRGVGYVCREKNKCVVDLSRRNQCQACRMKKCLAVGMKKDAVQHERAPRMPKQKMNQFSPFPRVVDYSKLAPSILHHLPSRQVASDSTVAMSPPHTPKEQILISTAEELYKTVSKLLVEAITWVRNIPTFTELPFYDQAILLEHSWCELFILSLSYWNIPLDIDFLLQLGNYDESKNDKCNAGKKDTISELVHLKSIVQRFRLLNLDSTEFACVKAVILFDTELRGIRATEHIEKFRDEAQAMLDGYTSSRASSKLRFGKILLKLPLLSVISTRLIEDCFFKGTIANINTVRPEEGRTKPQSPSPLKCDVNNNDVAIDDEEMEIVIVDDDDEKIFDEKTAHKKER